MHSLDPSSSYLPSLLCLTLYHSTVYNDTVTVYILPHPCKNPTLCLSLCAMSTYSMLDLLPCPLPSLVGRTWRHTMCSLYKQVVLVCNACTALLVQTGSIKGRTMSLLKHKLSSVFLKEGHVPQTYTAGDITKPWSSLGDPLSGGIKSL